MKFVLLLVVAGNCCFWLAGCAKVSGPTSDQAKIVATDLKIIDKDGSAAMQFGHWVLVIEAVPAKSTSLGSGGSINYPDPGNSGGSSTSFGDLKIKQEWNGQENSITVNGTNFKLTDAGSKLVFADHNYEAGDAPKTIIIDKDGKTREEAHK